jgi:hypothetical protein
MSDGDSNEKITRLCIIISIAIKKRESREVHNVVFDCERSDPVTMMIFYRAIMPFTDYPMN